VIKLLLLTLIFTATLFAQKVLYVTYEKTPERVIKGEIFTITLKTLPVVRNFKKIKYNFSNHPGLSILNTTPIRKKKGKFFYDTFNILVTKKYAKLPDIKVSLIAQRKYDPTFLKGEKLNVITLNPKKNFSNIIANSMKLQEYKTTSYDKSHNIIVFIATAKNANLKAMHFQNVYKQGRESFKGYYKSAKITYYVVIDKRIENFTFSYFNLLNNRYNLINIPIVVDDDSVSTQSDLKPRDQSHDMLKTYIAIGIIAVILLFVFIRKKYIYLIFTLIPLGYIIYLNMPEQDVCIKKGANILLLPVENGTVFETTQQELHLQKEGSVSNFTKVKLQNEKIGWVKNENTCTY